MLDPQGREQKCWLFVLGSVSAATLRNCFPHDTLGWQLQLLSIAEGFVYFVLTSSETATSGHGRDSGCQSTHSQHSFQRPLPPPTLVSSFHKIAYGFEHLLCPFGSCDVHICQLGIASGCSQVLPCCKFPLCVNPNAWERGAGPVGKAFEVKARPPELRSSDPCKKARCGV